MMNTNQLWPPMYHRVSDKCVCFSYRTGYIRQHATMAPTIRGIGKIIGTEEPSCDV